MYTCCSRRGEERTRSGRRRRSLPLTGAEHASRDTDTVTDANDGTPHATRRAMRSRRRDEAWPVAMPETAPIRTTAKRHNACLLVGLVALMSTLMLFLFVEYQGYSITLLLLPTSAKRIALTEAQHATMLSAHIHFSSSVGRTAAARPFSGGCLHPTPTYQAFQR